MGTLSEHEPLLLNKADEADYAKKVTKFIPFVQWVIKFIIWVIFVAWGTLIVLYPTKFMQGILESMLMATIGTIFGITGSVFLVFSGPVLLMTFLSFAYLMVSPAEEFHGKKKLKFPTFRLWTFPVLVGGPFGVVSAAELIGIVFFIVYLFWAVAVYTIQNRESISKFNLPFWEESYQMLELSGLRIGSIGLFCLALLFIPITRGSFLLRFIDIPFEVSTRYHVWLGHLTMVIFSVHGLCYSVAWAMQGRLLEEMLQWNDFGIANLPGVISLAAGLLMWVTSFHPVRKQYFELFFYTHQLYVVFFVFMALHAGDFVFSIAAGGIFLFLLDRFLRFCQSRKTVDLLSATCLPCGTVELVISKPKNLQYNALNFVFLQVRELSWLQWHPFSVSSSPLDGKHHMSVLIKVLGGWTKKLKDNISKVSEEPDNELSTQLHPRLTASVEGPYGHASPYHLMYENLILVAGGIGISPFLAILTDIFHRVELSKPCLPKNILVVWAVKRTNELSLFSSVDIESVCPSFADKIKLEMHTYITQETEPPLEDGEVHKSTRRSHFPMKNQNKMSGLAGTANNIWPGIYAVTSTIGFIIFMALTELFYIKPFGITAWWLKGLLFVACMIASIVVFGGLVVVLWHLCERRDLNDAKWMEEDEKSNSVQYNKLRTYPDAYQTTVANLTTANYGRRPDFEEIFHSASERWGGDVDVGVIVCGPSTLESSVAKECRSKNIKRSKNQPFFHFNSHSFEL
ncbi:ferric reduction oxidase 6-like [Papaver somniferum]|uniref:ferric reduction oxidase 6-like n=1 Tax=Papaver somniferum TaxID=3469 RepID=UPI000E700737|nr:ferric reduction oxidase 6-like [Papaver somniferum]